MNNTVVVRNYNIEFDDSKLMSIVNKALKDKEVKEKGILTISIVMLIKIAEKLNVENILEFEKNNFNTITSNLNFVNIGVYSNLSARLIVTSLRGLIPKLESYFDTEYGKVYAKRLEMSLTFLLGLSNALLIKGVRDGGLLISLVTGIGGLLVVNTANVISKKGLINGNDALLSINALNSLSLENSIAYILGVPVFSKLVTAKKKIKVISHIDKTGRNYIPVKIFKNGALPVLVAYSTVSILSLSFPVIGTIKHVNWLIGILTLLFNVLSNRADTIKINKELREDGYCIEEVKGSVVNYLDKQMILTDVIGGSILAALVIVPGIFGINLNIGNIVLLASVVNELYTKINYITRDNY